jgi:glyoxylase-like metal-dependent hydrolase (beta-lactamase superfamily II)
VYFRQVLNDETACASYLLGCKSKSRFAVVDPHVNLVVELGNTIVEALSTPGHAAAHHAYLVTDLTRGDDPWMVLTGDALLVGDAGRPDLHAHGEQSAVEALVRDIPPAPPQQAEILAANRTGRSLVEQG